MQVRCSCERLRYDRGGWVSSKSDYPAVSRQRPSCLQGLLAALVPEQLLAALLGGVEVSDVCTGDLLLCIECRACLQLW